jgi:hypothetical protein
MKCLIIFLLCLVSFTANGQVKHHNQIDDIKTVEQAEKLVRQAIKDTNFRMTASGQTIKLWFNPDREDDCSKLGARIDTKAWEKADFDGNGYTDLMVMGLSGSDPVVICLLDSGDNRFLVKCITNRSFPECAFPVVKKIDGLPAILYYRFSQENWRERPPDSGIVEIDTLIFNWGDFVEYHHHPRQYKIRSIEFETTPCFGSCPVFKLTINTGQKAYLQTSQYNDIFGGKLKDGMRYVGSIDDDNWQMITGLLNYIDFVSLKSKYEVSWTDDQSCTLTVTYNNGHTKTIDDYGLIGTHGLARLYRLLFNLRSNQQWTNE